MDVRLIFKSMILAAVVAGCSNGGGSAGPAAPAPSPSPVVVANPENTFPDIQGDFSYEMKVNGCSTGRQKFNSKKAYCDGLLSDSLNGNCARELRVETYNRMCTGTAGTQVSTVPTLSTARCVVNGMDLKDRNFLDDLNPFNPQRRQSFRDIFWDGKREQAYNIMMMGVETYGRARFIMTPSTSEFPALGEVRIEQSKGRDIFSARAGLGSQVRLVVSNYESEKEVEVVCRSDNSFRRTKADLRSVKCLFNKGTQADSSKEELLAWDLKHSVTKEIHRGRSGELLNVRLVPASEGKEERIEIEAVVRGSDRSLKVEGALNEGLELRHRGKDTGAHFALSCALASK